MGLGNLILNSNLHHKLIQNCTLTKLPLDSFVIYLACAKDVFLVLSLEMWLLWLGNNWLNPI